MRNNTMEKSGSRGFTLIASLMMLLLLSGIAIGLLMMVNTEGKVGMLDNQNNQSFHSAEGAIEKMTSDLANTFQNIESPTAADISGLSALAPASTKTMSYPVYTLTAATNPDGSLATAFGQIATGPYQGLYAQLLPVSLQATAQGPLGAEVNMSRTVEVALIPVFQFGVFSDGDLGFFSSPDLNFAGRVHTNGDLYVGVANCCTLTFHDKITAYGNVIRAVLPNGLSAASYNDNGTVQIPTTSGGCDKTKPNCMVMGSSWGSVTGAGGNPPASGYNSGPPSWQTISLSSTKYNGWIIDGDYGNTTYGTGATNLTLPFIGGTATGATTGPQPFEIIRRPPAGESVTSPLGASRLYNEAEIRVLISDTPVDLPGGATDPQNVRLANVGGYVNGVPTSVVAGLPGLPAGHSYTTYFATASTAVPDPATWKNTSTNLPADWLYQPLAPSNSTLITLYDANAPLITDPTTDTIGLSSAPPAITLSACNTSTGVCPPYPYYTPVAYASGGTPSPSQATPPTASAWNLLDGYLRVEYRDSSGNYHPVTKEWLGLGFARGTLPPTAPGGSAGANPINPDAILLFQEPANRDGNGTVDSVGLAPACVRSGTRYTCTIGRPPEVTVDSATNSAWYGDSTGPGTTQGPTMYNWYPINFYDAREGEPRDTIAADNSCTPAGIMNAVEIDVGNLKRWLAGKTGASGSSVDYVSQNGYVLYFSDRRGMLPNPRGSQVDPVNTKTGDSGLEDSINASSSAGTPDGTLDPIPTGKPISPEDVNEDGVLENFGGQNIGLGLGYIGAAYSTSNNVNRKILATGTPNPYVRIAPSCAIAQNGWVSGARHALKLVDGGLGNLPLRPDNSKGGFTIGSENPVYIYGDYNTNAGDPIWDNPPGADQPHAAAAVIGDAVTMLSDSWSDLNSILLQPTQPSPNRNASTTYYRVAIAAGKNMNFPFPSWENSTDYGFGTDGGVHNFLRFLEDWQDPGATLNYQGSLVSLYYSTYNTGTFKCCSYSVYQPPNRNYIFDSDFTQPQNLPPGTPMFRDINNLSYRQNLTAHTGCY